MQDQNKTDIFSSYINLFNRKEFQTLNEEMSFSDYLQKCKSNPKLARNSYQYVYDMIMEQGTEQFERYRTTYTKYNFFSDTESPIFGLEETLSNLVDFIHGAAGGYGTERRVLLLHGPVGSSKSTICRSLKRGLEKYSRTENGAWYTFKWVNLPTETDSLGPAIFVSKEDACVLNENPLKLMSEEMRKEFMKDLNTSYYDSLPDSEKNSAYRFSIEGDLNPRCRLFMKMLLNRYDGDLRKVLENHIRVIRKVHSESDRVGIGTFQPKDEKNQDSTELNGDMNFSKIGEFGSDSDPRAFNFDGEFEVANRGICEFIEMLKLDNAFLYDLLGATQEHQIKPKKFSQVMIDEFIIGHSVHGDTPIPHLYNEVLDVLPISELVNLEVSKLKVFSVNEETHEIELTEIKSVFSHDFEGDWIQNEQDDEVVTTTPNHSVYNENYETFYPGEDETSNILRLIIPENLTSNYLKTERWVRFFAEIENKAELA